MRRELRDLLKQYSAFPEKGCYQLVLHFAHPVRISVGKKGDFLLEAGDYLYTGSHQSALRKRLLRHLAQSKKMHWHIDYLTAHREAQFRNILVFPNCQQECLLNQRAQQFFRGTFPIPGFGNGDCRFGCPAHLVYLPSPNPARLKQWGKENGVCTGFLLSPKTM